MSDEVNRDPNRDKQAEELLKRALIDSQDSTAISLPVGGLPLSEKMTVIFHARRDLGVVQTYVSHGTKRPGNPISATDLLRVPCDLDLGDADDLDEAHHLYAEQARALSAALVGADTVLEIWHEQLQELVGGEVLLDRSTQLNLSLPAHRLMPTALVAPERQLVITPVCGARTLAKGKPPLGIACAQQDVARVYPLPDDPERCLADFDAATAEHARKLAEHIARQEASVMRFIQLSEED